MQTTWIGYVSVFLKKTLVFEINRALHLNENIFTSSIRDLKNNEISWTIEDMNGAFSGLDKLRRL